MLSYGKKKETEGEKKKEKSVEFMAEMASNSPDGLYSGRHSGQREPEKSRFSQTCSLLSQYLKEKRSLGDLNLTMTCKLQEKERFDPLRPATMNLLSGLETPEGVTEKKEGVTGKKEGVSERNATSTDPFPQRAGFSAPAETRPPTTVVPVTAQMTIFYAGRVMVFDDFPAEKAKEIMLAASKAVMVPSNNAAAAAAASATRSSDRGKSPQRNSDAVASTSASIASSHQHHLQWPLQAQADASDLPIARKVSLHRFLEKRKGRISSKAPYRVDAGPTEPAKREDS